MIIDEIRRSETDAANAVECRVRFEARDVGPERIYARTEPPYSLEPDPNAFLLGAFLPAWAAGESRIAIDGAVCPLLAANLTVAASLLRTWFTDLPAPPAIGADYQYRPAGTKSAAFLSGGVDSLAMVRTLMDMKPLGHPDRPSAALVVDYQYMGGISREETDARFARSVATSREVCADLGLEVIPISSNFCRLNGSMRFWMYRYHGAFLASMAHFCGDIRQAYIASSYPATHVVPWGSHPQLDPLYSSQHVRISHDGIELSRLQKVRSLRRWPAALDRVYVCTSDTSDGANCGTCEKCVRTRVHLLVAGALADAGAFKGGNVSADEIHAVRLRSEYARICFEEALPGLRDLGRADLVAAVDRVLDDYRQSQRLRAAARPGFVLRVGRKVRRLLLS